MSPPNDCLVRRLQAPDVPAVLDVIRATRREYGLEQHVTVLIEPEEYELFRLYRRRRSAYFVAVAEGEVVGGAGIAPLAGGERETCELQKMYLRPEVRGTGLGRELLSACLGAARSFGFTRCYAETLATMTAALALYERSGFRPLASPIGLTGHPHTDCWMMLEIPPPVAGPFKVDFYA